MNCKQIRWQLPPSLFLSSFVGRQPKLDEMNLAPYRSCRRAVCSSAAQTSQRLKNRGYSGVSPERFSPLLASKVARRRPTPTEELHSSIATAMSFGGTYQQTWWLSFARADRRICARWICVRVAHTERLFPRCRTDEPVSETGDTQGACPWAPFW